MCWLRRCANRELARLTAELREENERLRAENAEQAAELGKLRADLAVCSGGVGAVVERSRRSRRAVQALPLAGRVPGPARGGNAAREHGQGGGITRTAPVRGVLGFPRGRVLLPGMRGAVHAAG